MIKVNIIINQAKKIEQINVAGHSEKNLTTKIEPLCATVSTVVLGTMNAFLQLPKIKNKIQINKNPGNITFINIQKDSEVDLILQVMITQLQTITLYFKKGIKINYQKKKNYSSQ